MNFLPFLTLSLTSSDGRLNAAQVFTGLVYLNMIRIPVIILPITFSMAADMKVAFGRIGQYLLSDELNESAQPTIIHDPQYPNAIEIHDATFSWDVAPYKIAQKDKKKDNEKKDGIKAMTKQPAIDTDKKQSEKSTSTANVED